MTGVCANKEAFSLFEGHWLITRVISNGVSAQGHAEFRRRSTGILDYIEVGALSSGECFSKQYRYCLQNRVIRVEHNDRVKKGQPFHEIEFSRQGGEGDGILQARAKILCGHDHYDSTYEVAQFGIKLVHLISGPRKDYQIETQFTRQASNENLQPSA